MMYYITQSKMEKLMKDNIETVVDVLTRRIVQGIVEEPIEDVFSVVYD